MDGTIKFLQYQLLANWRRSFSTRGKYDRFSFILVLIFLLSAYRFILFLNQTAKSLANGNPENLNLLLGIVFFVWLLPAFESQGVSGKFENFLYLPLTKTQFTLVNLANIFLIPTSIIAFIVSFATVYPLAFAKHLAIGFVGLCFYLLFAAFSLTLFVRLLKLKFFRVLIILLTIVLTFFIWKSEFNLSLVFLPQNLFAQIILGENQVANILFLAIFSITSFFLVFIAIRLTLSISTTLNRSITPQWHSKISLPIRFGELIKKDFFSAWKILDCYFSLLITIIYAIILVSSDISFLSFSVAISFSIMMSGSLAFNIFGTENLASFERLSLSPIKPEDLFITKNKVFIFLIFSQNFFLLPLIFFKFGLIYLLVAILKTILVCLLYMAWGNNLSINFPFKMNFYEVSFGGSIQDMISAVSLISLISILPDFLLTENSIAILLINIVLAIFTCLIYKFSLRCVSNKLSGKWENIAFKLS